MITSATRPLMPNLVFVCLAGACPRIGEVVIPGVYFLPFSFFYFLTFLLTCGDRIVCRRNVVNGSYKTCFREFNVVYTVRVKILRELHNEEYSLTCLYIIMWWI